MRRRALAARAGVPSVASTEVARCPLYGVSPLAIASVLPVSEEQAAALKAELRARSDKKPAEALAKLARRDLGAYASDWDGFTVAGGVIWTPDGASVTPGQIQAIPYYRAQLQEFNRAQRWQLQEAERSSESQRALSKLAEVERLVATLNEALRQR